MVKPPASCDIVICGMLASPALSIDSVLAVRSGTTE
jgi:hypothetical protein